MTMDTAKVTVKCGGQFTEIFGHWRMWRRTFYAEVLILLLAVVSPAMAKDETRPSELPNAGASQLNAGETGTYCPSGWHMVDGACFMITEPMSWYEARDHCTREQSKANLAFFDSQQQFDRATSLTEDMSLWIGLYSAQRSADKNFTWINSPTYKLPFKAWAENEPNLGSEACVATSKMKDEEGGWQDEPCYTKLPFICQRHVLAGSNCGRGWRINRSNNICYWHSENRRLSWFDARHFCSSKIAEAELVTPENHDEEYFLNYILPLSEKTWIGVWDQHMNNNWMFTNGKPVGNWSNWRDGQPDNGGHLAMHCATQGCHSNSGWLQDHCIAHRAFICEINMRNASCPPKWTEWDYTVLGTGTHKYCYKKHEVRATWYKARQTCKQEGADLITIDTKEKSAFLKNELLKMKVPSTKDMRWWIGLNSLQIGFRWTWLDRTDQLTFVDWENNSNTLGHDDKFRNNEDLDAFYNYFEEFKENPEEIPDWFKDKVKELKDEKKAEWQKLPLTELRAQHGLGGSEHHDDRAVIMLTLQAESTQCPAGTGCWMNVPHTAHFPALCEIDHAECMEVDGDGMHHEGHCYRVLPPDEWGSQDHNCKQLAEDNKMSSAKSYLAVINDKDELEYLIEQLQKPERREDSSPGVYIGLNSFRKPRTFTFLSNDKHDNETVKYVNWLVGEPHQRPQHQCVMAAPDAMHTMKWSDANCLVRMPAMCRRRPLNASIYYDFKMHSSIYKVTHLKASGQTDFTLLCEELLGGNAQLVSIDSIMEYHLLTNFLHYEFSGAADLWIGNFSRVLQWGTHVPVPESSRHCPPVLTLAAGMTQIGDGSCCENRYALCEKTIKQTSAANYDLKVGNKLYRFVTSPVNISFPKAHEACRKMPIGHFPKLLTIQSPEEYMKISAEMRVLEKADSVYWIGRSMSWLDYVGSNEFVIRNVPHRGSDYAVSSCLSASLSKTESRRLTKHDYLHIEQQECDNGVTMKGYICESQVSLLELSREHSYIRRIFADMLSRYFRFNTTAFINGLKISGKLPKPTTTPQPPASECGPPCIGLGVALPFLCIACFIFGYLASKYCRKGGYRLMTSHRHHRMSELDIPFSEAT